MIFCASNNYFRSTTMNDLRAQCMKTNIFVFIRYWRSTLSATENGFWPHWGTGYTKTPHRNLHGPSPYGWVSLCELTVCGFTHDNIEQYLNQLGFKLSWLYKTVVPFPDGSISLREIQPPHCCSYHPNDYPNLWKRRKMAVPPPFPPCWFVLDATHNELAFPLPSQPHSYISVFSSPEKAWKSGGSAETARCA